MGAQRGGHSSHFKAAVWGLRGALGSEATQGSLWGCVRPHRPGRGAWAGGHILFPRLGEEGVREGVRGAGAGAGAQPPTPRSKVTP